MKALESFPSSVCLAPFGIARVRIFVSISRDVMGNHKKDLAAVRCDHGDWSLVS